MGKKLNNDEAYESQYAVKKYEKIHGFNTYRKVTVYQNGSKILGFDTLHVITLPGSYGDSDLRKVEIFWEEAGLTEYKNLGLYGIYSCDYCNMSFNNGNLTIYGDNKISIDIS